MDGLTLPSMSNRRRFPSSVFLVVTFLWTTTTRTIVPVQAAEGSGKHPGTPSLACPGPCDVHEFCGRDGRCHAYTCRNWYDRGPLAFTNRDDPRAQPLSCRSLSFAEPDTSFLDRYPLCERGLPLATLWVTEVEAYHRISSRTGRYCSNTDDTTTGVVLAALPFDRKCTAQLNATEAFVCYEVSNVAVTNYAAQVAQVLATQRVSTKGVDGNATAVTSEDAHLGVHLYRTELVSFRIDSANGNGNDDEDDNDPVVIKSYFPYQHGMPGQQPGNFSFARAAVTMLSSRDQVFPRALPFCPDGCAAHEFCGNDDLCHAIGDCEVFYRYGPSTMTGRLAIDEDDGTGDSRNTTLTCTTEYQYDFDHHVCFDDDWWLIGENANATPVWPVALTYECSPSGMYTTGEPPCPARHNGRRTPGRELDFSRMCTARPNEHQRFVCFDTQGILDSDVDHYVQTVTDDPRCTVEDLASGFPDMSNWTNCVLDDATERQCFRADHVYTDGVRNASWNVFLYPYSTRRNALSEEVDMVDRTWLDLSMYAQLFGEVPSSGVTASYVPRWIMMAGGLTFGLAWMLP